MFRVRLRTVPLVAVLVASALVLLNDGLPTSAAGGLLNPGFESGILGGDPVDWSVAARRDSVRVVDAETAGEFPVFTDMGVDEVRPYKGGLMLRLGTPQRLDANQPKGNNTVVSTAFTPTSPNLRIAFRAFSWEHRGQDLVKIDVRQGSVSVGDLEASVAITTRPTAGNLIYTCTDIPCQFPIDVGSQGDHMDSGWKELHVTNLPLTGGPLTVTYQVSGTGDASKPTFAYFDNVNTPPVAKFTFEPTNPQEGDVIQFMSAGQSYDPDGDPIVSWKWAITEPPSTPCPEGCTAEIPLENPFYVFNDQGENYDATLTVCDALECSSVTDGFPATDGTLVRRISVSNMEPFVDALDVEALPGEEVLQVGRFIDGGADDTHTASFSTSPLTALETLEEEHEPLWSTGLITELIAPGTSVTGATLTVTDDEGASNNPAASYDITVLQGVDPQTWREGNDTIAGVLADPTNLLLTADGSYISFLQETGDIELFEVRHKDGSLFGPGDEVLANLIDPPGDYDLTLLRMAPGGSGAALTGESALPRVGFTEFAPDTESFADLASRGIASRGIASRGIASRGIASRGIASRGIASRGISFRDLASRGIASRGIASRGIASRGIGTEVIATDMSLAELGLGSIGGTGIQVADFSASRGLGSEFVYGVSAAEDTKFFIAVTGNQGAHSLSPMSISVEAREQLDLQALLGTKCLGQAEVSPQAAGWTLPYPGAAETLIVLQEERLRKINNMTQAQWDDFLNNYLQPLAMESTVKGTIVSLPSGIYDASDGSPCNVDLVNGITAQIRNVIRGFADIQNVVFVGGDDSIPFHRVLDEGATANESEYLADSFLQPGSKLYASIALGYVLEDNYYVDDAPDAVGFGVPERSIGRLVESVDDIKAQITAYLGSGGILEPSTGFVSGFDFFDDGANAIADELDAALPVPADRLITPGTEGGWTSDQLRCRFLGQANVPGCTTPATPDVNSLNAHFTHFLAPSALGYTGDDPGGPLTNNDVAAAQASAGGRVVFSMGCHAGFNVPNADSESDAALGLFPGDDFPDVFRTAIYVANTGYGIGNDAGVSQAEELMRLFAEKLLAGNGNAGQALADAKQVYMSSLLSVTDYDIKTMLQATLYGMPTYTVTPAAATATATALLSVPVVETFTLTTVDNTADVGLETAISTYAYNETLQDAGTHFALDDLSTPGVVEEGAQATPGRAIQPRATTSLEARHGQPPPGNRGILLTAGSYEDSPPDFNPNIANLQNEWLPSGEPQVCQTAFWPADQAAANGDTFVVVPGQFRCVPGETTDVRGVERLWSAQTYEIRYCQSSDGRAPEIQSVDLQPGLVTVYASDRPDGIEQISVLLLANGVIQRYSLDVPPSDRFNESFTIPVQGLESAEIMIQVLSIGCDVTTWTAKGAGLSFITVDAGADRVVTPGQTVELTAAVENFNSLPTPVTFIWDFGDGTFQDGILAPAEFATVPVTVNPLTGVATFPVSHTYATLPQMATVRVYDAGGGTGHDDVRVLCDPTGDAQSPDSDWVGCGSSNTNSKMTISVTVDAPVNGGFQYRVFVDAGKYNTKRKRWDQPPDGTFDALLKYNGGQVSGLTSLTVQVVGNQLNFTFDLAEFGLSAGKEVRWYAETQAGVPGEPATGHVDRMPDAGWFSHRIQ